MKRGREEDGCARACLCVCRWRNECSKLTFWDSNIKSGRGVPIWAVGKKNQMQDERGAENRLSFSRSFQVLKVACELCFCSSYHISFPSEPLSHFSFENTPLIYFATFISHSIAFSTYLWGRSVVESQIRSAVVLFSDMWNKSVLLVFKPKWCNCTNQKNKNKKRTRSTWM